MMKSDISPGYDCFAITPSDVTEYSKCLRGIYVGIGGDIAVVTQPGRDPVIFKNVGDGSSLNVNIYKIMNTDTTATDLVGIY